LKKKAVSPFEGGEGAAGLLGKSARPAGRKQEKTTPVKNVVLSEGGKRAWFLLWEGAVCLSRGAGKRDDLVSLRGGELAQLWEEEKDHVVTEAEGRGV